MASITPKGDLAQDKLRGACAELEQRLRAGEACAAEEYLSLFPELAADLELALDLIYTEFVTREQSGQAGEPEGYYARFPQWRERLERLFDLHSKLGQSGREVVDQATLVTLSLTADTPRVKPVDGTIPVLRDYEVLEEVGRGGMGVVYRARHIPLNRIVALKVCLDADYMGSQGVARFRAEAEAVARLQHANIVQIHEVGAQGERPFLSLEFLSGGSLQQRLTGTPQPGHGAAQLVETLARAIQHAHQRKVVHRDLKPANVLFSADGVPKIGDFGLAKRLDTVGQHTQTGAILGTPSYMAPEQAGGRSGEIGPACDVYALGAVLYELLTGRPPFRGETLVETLDLVRGAEPVPPRRLRPQLPRDLEIIVLKCLEKDPRKRYASAEALAEDLRRFLHDEPIVARRVNEIERGYRWARRKPALAALIIVLVTALCVLPTAAMWYQQRLASARHSAAEASKSEQAARLAEAAAQENADTQRYFALLNKVRQNNLHAEVGWTASGLDLLSQANHLQTPSHDPVELRTEAIACLAGVDLRQATVLAEGFNASCLCFSPDGKFLAIAQQKSWAFLACRVLVIEVASGKTIHDLSFVAAVTEGQAGPVQDGVLKTCFSPDGKWLVASTRSGWLHRWDLADAKPQATSWQGHTKRAVGVVFHKGGKDLFSCSEDGTLKRWSVARGWTESASATVKYSFTDLAISPDGGLLAGATRWDVRWFTTRLQPEARQPTEGSQTACFSPDGNFFATERATGSCAILLMDRHRATPIDAFLDPQGDAAHDYATTHLEFHPSGTWIVSSSSHERDRKVKIWEAASGRLLITLVIDGMGIIYPTFSPNGHYLAITADRKTVLYEMCGLEPQRVIAARPFAVQAIDMTRDGRSLACVARISSHQCEISAWRVKDGGRLRMREWQWGKNDDSTLPSATLSSGGTVMAYTSWADHFHVWTFGAGEPHPVPAAASSLVFAPDGKTLWGVVRGEELQSWDLAALTPQSRWVNSASRVLTGLGSFNCLTVRQDWVLAGGRDGMVRLFRVADGQLQKAWPCNGAAIRSVALSPDESLAIAGTQRGPVYVHRVPGGELVAQLDFHRDSVESVACEAGFLATGARDRTVAIWRRDGDSFQQLVVLKSPTGPVNALRLSRDGNTLVLLVNKERAVRVWDVDALRKRLEQMNLGW